ARLKIVLERRDHGHETAEPGDQGGPVLHNVVDHERGPLVERAHRVDVGPIVVDLVLSSCLWRHRNPAPFQNSTSGLQMYYPLKGDLGRDVKRGFSQASGRCSPGEAEGR